MTRVPFHPVTLTYYLQHILTLLHIMCYFSYTSCYSGLHILQLKRKTTTSTGSTIFFLSTLLILKTVIITTFAVGAPSCSWLRCNLLTKGFHGVTFLSQRKRQEICCHIVPKDPPPHLTRSIVEHEKLMEISGWQIGEHTRVTEADSEK